MTSLTEVNNFDTTVYQIEATDPVQGGVGGIANVQAQSLADRTRWLYNQVANILAALATAATLNSPAFTGTPTAPTAAAGDNSTTLSNTAFVQRLADGYVSVNVAGNSNVVLSAAQYGIKIVEVTGALTGNIAVIFPAQSGDWDVKNDTTGAFSVTFRTGSGTGVAVAQGQSRHLIGDATNIYEVGADAAAPSSSSSASVSGTYLPGFYEVDTTAGPVTITAESVPAYGDSYTFTDAAKTFGVNAFTINGNGHNIGTPLFGYVSTVTASVSDIQFGIWFDGANWRLR